MLETYKRALAASEARFHNLIEKSADGVVVISTDGNIFYVNPAGESLLGRPASELIGSWFGRPLAPGDIAEIELHPPSRAQSKQVNAESVQILPSYRIVEMRVVDIDWGGQPAYLATLRDVTERKEAVRRRDEFLAMLAHELRNPLAPIISAAQFMRIRGLPSSELEDARQVIERQSRHLVRLLDDLLDLSRITHGKVELRQQTVDLRSLLTDAVQASGSIIESRNHKLSILTPSESVWVQADHTRLTQVIVNLLNNAAKYTPPGGQIDLTLRTEDLQAVLSIKDNGLGIPEANRSTIFDLFTQLHVSLERLEGGLGIGLTLARRIVELHGGTIEVYSAGEGKGSDFIVRLPRLATISTPAAAPTSTTSETVFVPRNILLVEDNQDNREMLRNLLLSWGHRVEGVGDGLEGLEAIRRSMPEVALIDLGLPSMDGYELARQVRSLPGGDNVRLIAVTGYGQPDDRRRALEAGFDLHLVKPVDLHKLEQFLAYLSKN
jgi:PAS domain S-box-containing protein